ncbi:MAG: hypothetical protein ACRCVN_02600 [Spirochaetia bacterium]
MNFYIYEKEDNGQEMLALAQRLVADAQLSASIYLYDETQKLHEHSFDLLPALFLDGNLLIEGDTPPYEELCMLVGVALQVYGYISGGSCSSGGGCPSSGCSGCDPIEEEILEESSACACGGNCTCNGAHG